MATFIAISGPSATGKTSLVDNLSSHLELAHAKFSPDFHESVMKYLIEGGWFADSREIITDVDYLCTYIVRLTNYYEEYINSYKDTGDLVILDGCWLDFSIYSIINMWYTRIVKEVQEDILSRLNKLSGDISRIYLTKRDDDRFPVERYRLKGKDSSFRQNRNLESQYYSLAAHSRNAISLPSSDVSEASIFIIEDLKKIGYL